MIFVHIHYFLVTWVSSISSFRPFSSWLVLPGLEFFFSYPTPLLPPFGVRWDLPIFFTTHASIFGWFLVRISPTLFSFSSASFLFFSFAAFFSFCIFAFCSLFSSVPSSVCVGVLSLLVCLFLFYYRVVPLQNFSWVHPLGLDLLLAFASFLGVRLVFASAFLRLVGLCP